MTSPTIKHTDLTPELAAVLLAKPHARQRRAAPTTVANYAEQMRQGRWRPDVPDPLLVDSDGRLFNGAHRCAAVIASGVTISVLVAYGADPAMYDVIDSGRRRQAGQFILEPNAHARASSARVQLWYRRRFEHSALTIRATVFPMDVVLAEADRTRDELTAAVGQARRIYDLTSLAVSTTAAAFVIAAEDEFASWDQIDTFVEGVIDPHDLARDDPRWLLAERMRLQAIRNHRRPPQEDWTTVVRSLNRFVLGERVDQLRLTMLAPRVGETEREYAQRFMRVKRAGGVGGASLANRKAVG